MSVAVFVAFFGLGAAALALWTDARFEDKRPQDIRGALLHVGLAWCVAQFLAGSLLSALADAGYPLAAVVLVGLPVSVYCLLSILWLMRLASGILRSRFQ